MRPLFDAFLAPVVVTMSPTPRGEPPLAVVTTRLFAEFDSRRRLGEIVQPGTRAGVDLAGSPNLAGSGPPVERLARLLADTGADQADQHGAGAR